MSYIRVNKLLRAGNLTIEQLAELMGVASINPNQKLGFIDTINNETVAVHANMDSDTLIAIRDAINGELGGRLATMKDNYLEFKGKVKGN